MKQSSKAIRAASSPDPGRVSDAAAHWLARREAGLTAGEQEQFSNWILADRRHAEAVKQIESAWRYMQKPRYTGQSEEVIRGVEQRVRIKIRARRHRAWHVTLAGFAAAAAVVLGFQLLGDREAIAPSELAARVEIKPERQLLADGSVVELNAGAEVAVSFTPQSRGVRLVRGEAHFAVARESRRPFIVTAGAVSVRAVGTEFAVRFDPAAVDVLVTEGRVAVERAAVLPTAVDVPPNAAPILLEAGTKTVVPTAMPVSTPLQVQAVAAAEIQTALAWRNMRMEFTATPLGAIVARFNQRNRLQLSLGDAALEEIRISGIFWLDDPEGFSRLIEASAGLEATRESGERIVLTRP